MASAQEQTRPRLASSAVQIFSANQWMNQMLIEHLAPPAWRAKPAGGIRTIAAIFTHMHNVRAKWVRLNAPHLQTPLQLNRKTCTPEEAVAGLEESATRCTEMLAEAFSASPTRIQEFRRDGWAPAWPVGIEMLCYMLSHEAHHRGQVCLLAHQLSYPVPSEVAYGLWDWTKLWKALGSPSGPGRSNH